MQLLILQVYAGSQLKHPVRHMRLDSWLDLESKPLTASVHLVSTQ